MIFFPIFIFLSGIQLVTTFYDGEKTLKSPFSINVTTKARVRLGETDELFKMWRIDGL
jgi:hypothetical protein